MSCCLFEECKLEKLAALSDLRIGHVLLKVCPFPHSFADMEHYYAYPHMTGAD